MKLLIDMQGAQGVSSLRGIGRYSRELAHALATDARGHEVHLLFNGALGDGGDALWNELAGLLDTAARHTWWSVEETPGGATGPRHDVRRAAGEILRAEAIEAIAPDVLLVASVFEGAGEAVVPHWPGDRPRPPTATICYDLIPLLFRDEYLDGIWATNARMREWYFRCLHELASSDLLLAISECSRRDAIDQLALDEDRVVNVRAGKSPLFRPETLDEPARQALRDRYGVRDGFVVFVGAGDPRKNEARLLQAYGLLPPELRTRHQLVVVGATDPRDFRTALAAAGLGAEEARLIRFVDEADLPRLYAMATLAVLPSLYEGFGLPALEAMACGTPSIGSATGSLPEVLGLPEALFDPYDPADIARALQDALTDPALQARLRAHAPEQAARFGWDRTGAVAWEALQRLDARLNGEGGRRWQHQQLKRLAIVSPLPPERSGIADYTAELAPALADHYDVTLVSRTGGTDRERLRGVLRTMSATRFEREAGRFDRILHQLGNSAFHDFQFDGLLARHPGVATLHDAFLSGYAAGVGQFDSREDSFAVALHESHGWPAVVQLVGEGQSAALSAWPCSLPVLRDTLGLVQHSDLAAAMLRHYFGPAASGPTFVIPHLRRLPPPADRARARVRLGLDRSAKIVATFGSIAELKLPNRLVAARDHVSAPPGPDVRFAFVGEVVESLKLPTTDPRFIFAGRTTQATYADWLAAADVAVQLRASSRGETSGAVADCLAAGLPLIANDHGTVTEIPADCLRLVPEHFSDADLGAAISALLADAEAARALGARARQWVRETLSPATIARAYRDAIEEVYADPDAFRRIGDPFRGSHLPAGDAEAWAAVARATVAACPTRRPPWLLLDVTGDWPERGAATAMLGSHPHDVRVELVQLDTAAAGASPQHYRTAPDRAAEWLGIPAQPIAAHRVAVLRGDVLVLPENADLTVREAALREMRLRGAHLAEMGRDGAIRMRDDMAMPDWLAAWQAADDRRT